MHYWINGFTHTKRKGPMTMIITEEEEEVVVWCNDMIGMGHGMVLIQLKSTIVQIYQGRPNPFKYEFPRKSWWLGV